MDAYHVAVVGVGAVGQEMVRVLRQRRFPLRELRLLARTGREIEIDGERYSVQVAAPEAFEGIQIALFAGTEGEKGAAVTLAEEAIRRGAVVIDNGSDFRLDPRVPLVVPEVNGDTLADHRGIIANPNCSTAQLVHVLKPIHDLARLRRVIVSTYQSISGAGGGAVTELEAQVRALVAGAPLPPFQNIPAQLAMNVLPSCWRFLENGFQDEEWKMVAETRKILGEPDLAVTPTTVRVPVIRGHGESIYLETERKVTVDEARAALAAFPGIRIIDDTSPTERDPHRRTAPTPLDAAHRDETFVGRIREDPHAPNGLCLWCVADNLRKGAALNAVQIAEELIRRGLLGSTA
ncbi:MAG: aspartate-semialdehyde dehydrogenase [Armatimonadetes bacterium]|nr:aspartate-semialdehyde dehydrogenase [Armatimonadota bacterium]